MAHLRRPILLLSTAGLLAGCQNPLLESPEDLGRRLEPATFRSIDRVRLDRFRAAAGTPEDITSGTAASAARVINAAERIEISLDDARASALEHNLDVRTARYDPAIDAETLRAERAKFESTFTTRALWSESDSPTASELASAQAQNIQLEPGVRIPLRTGGTASVSLPMSRSRNNNAFSTLNPAYATDVELSISHNLLRDAGRSANNASIRIASYNAQAGEAATKLEVIRQLAAVDRAYWRLFQSRSELEVRQRQYELAQEQLERARRRVTAGSSPEIEITRAEAGLAERLEGIILTERAVLTRQRSLKAVINRPGLDVDTPTYVVPSSQPEPVEYRFDAAAVVSAAMNNRMELLETELRLAADAVNIQLAKNRALPLLALDYTYRVNGLDNDFGGSWNTTIRNNFEDWQVGLSAEIPLGNESAKALVRRAILQRLQRLSTRESRELAIRQEVLDALDAISTGWQRILAARQAAILAARTLQAEQRQFDVGLSTSTDVLDAAARLADAQTAEVRAVTDYQIAQVDLAFAAGVLLGASGVSWSPQETPSDREPAPIDDPQWNPPALPTADQPAPGVTPAPDAPGVNTPPAGVREVPASGG